MIISHKYRFIFLKTRKTAGTSIEIALSRLCGDDDVITPVSPKDEKLRSERQGRKAQNEAIQYSDYRRSDWLRCMARRKRMRFYNHAPAAFVKDHIRPEIWNDYFKFSFERNPFDKAVSRYFWSTRDPRPPVEDYLNDVSVNLLSNWEIYTINDHIAVDFMGRYENLENDLNAIGERIGLSAPLDLPRAKGGYRPKKLHHAELLTEKARRRVRTVCAKEIALLDYSW